MNELQKQIEPKDPRTTQQRHFDALYDAFYAFYAKALKAAVKPHEKVRLEMTAVFFDDLELLSYVRPVFEGGVSNVEEKRAAARVAYRDAQQAHYFGSMFAGERKEAVKIVEKAEK